LVLGAGASAAYSFPLGITLRNALLGHDQKLLGYLGDADFSEERWVAAQDLIGRGQFTSVDEFLATHSEYAEVTKVAIAYEIAKHETQHAHTNPQHADHLYNALFFDAIGNDPRLLDGLLSVVTFNYDLSLEAYLVETLKARHRLNDAAARERIAILRIAHVYGDLGPVQSIHGGGRRYGAFTDHRQLIVASRRIATCYEEASRDAVAEAQRQIAESDAVVFLGFGYSSENLMRLDLKTHLRPDATVLGSTYMCTGWRDRLTPHLHQPEKFIGIENTSNPNPTVRLFSDLIRSLS
jgi:hypothetical protein